jgi:hypothetical protein
MSAITPRFWAGPMRYLRWASREKPAYFWSVVIGALGPVSMVVVPPVRRAFGDFDAPAIPLTYPSMHHPQDDGIALVCTSADRSLRL